jgi:hypothetical protein
VAAGVAFESVPRAFVVSVVAAGVAFESVPRAFVVVLSSSSGLRWLLP